MNCNPAKKRRVTPEQAVKVLKAHGTDVTSDEAKIILEFMYNFAKLSVGQYVKVI